MVTLEKVETEEMPENDTEPAEPEIKEDAVEEAVEEKDIETRPPINVSDTFNINN